MASTSHGSLEAASGERKARLAKLASLKRKQPEQDSIQDEENADFAPSKTDIYLSGRNYDVATRGPKLGFESSPAANVQTLEQQAEAIATSTAAQAAKDEAEAADKGIDLFKLQPKKPNWDLKRDLAEKMKILDVRTQNAIAKLVRARIEKTKEEALQKQQSKSGSTTGGDGEGEEIGIGGSELVEGVHLREREEQEDEALEEDVEEEEVS